MYLQIPVKRSGKQHNDCDDDDDDQANNKQTIKNKQTNTNKHPGQEIRQTTQ